MPLNFKHLSLAIACTISLSGCGSSDSDSPSGNNNTDNGNNTSNSDANTGTGYYIDSAVEGVNFTCGTQSGVTDSDGKFTFEVDKDCNFTLGGITLRTVSAENLQDEIKIIEDEEDVARMLQTLDTDGDPSNGISILSAVADALEAGGINAIPVNDSQISVLFDAIKDTANYEGSIKSLEEAAEHLSEALESNLQTLLSGNTFYVVSSEEDVSFDASGNMVDTVSYSLESTTFNSDVTELVSTIISGEDTGEIDTIETRIEAVA